MESNPTMPNNIPNGQYKLSVYVIDAKENVMGCATSYIDIKLNDDRKQNN